MIETKLRCFCATILVVHLGGVPYITCNFVYGKVQQVSIILESHDWTFRSSKRFKQYNNNTRKKIAILIEFRFEHVAFICGVSARITFYTMVNYWQFKPIGVMWLRWRKKEIIEERIRNRAHSEKNWSYFSQRKMFKWKK